MRKGSSNFSRHSSNRIDEEAEHIEESSSESDYENELIPAPTTGQGLSVKPGNKASSNLFDAELDESGGGNGSDNENDLGINDEDNLIEEGDQDKEELIRERIAQSQEQMKHVLDLLSEDQLKRYETFRRVGFPRQGIRKVSINIVYRMWIYI